MLRPAIKEGLIDPAAEQDEVMYHAFDFCLMKSDTTLLPPSVRWQTSVKMSMSAPREWNASLVSWNGMPAFSQSAFTDFE